MNREIKFHGFCKDKNKWVYGNYHKIIGEGDMTERKFEGGFKSLSITFDCHYILEQRLPDHVGWNMNDSFRDYKVPKESVGQYTGLKDKNGKEIYEGDVVQMYRHDDFTHKHEKAKVWVKDKYETDVKEVKFYMGSFVIWSNLISEYRPFSSLARPGESLEIIGNIHENPDLLTPANH